MNYCSNTVLQSLIALLQQVEMYIHPFTLFNANVNILYLGVLCSLCNKNYNIASND